MRVIRVRWEGEAWATRRQTSRETCKCINEGRTVIPEWSFVVEVLFRKVLVGQISLRGSVISRREIKQWCMINGYSL